ncbi:hypothetical protein HHK36_032230 [Tetracentron sinense]|uniref:Uncharacterized protein n=1 Tax=Tetracentron sinense TaxID=13715 RepID=A0A835CZQ8_TETSI|nr:hypothetical protein HHK36_032230 [Tetracentron sinense]
MKNRASSFISVLSSAIKAKSMAVKSRTITMKTRLIVLSLLRNKKVLLGAISHKIHALLSQQHKTKTDEDDVGDQSKAIVLHNAMANESNSNPSCTKLLEDDYDDDKYPDLTHSLFDSDFYDDQRGSVIDLVRNSKEDGEDFRLEDEIDQVADLFIRRFHRQMRMQKQESFKRMGSNAYLKYLRPKEAGWKPKEFNSEFPYSIMFGADNCGSTNPTLSLLQPIGIEIWTMKKVFDLLYNIAGIPFMDAYKIKIFVKVAQETKSTGLQRLPIIKEVVERRKKRTRRKMLVVLIKGPSDMKLKKKYRSVVSIHYRKILRSEWLNYS